VRKLDSPPVRAPPPAMVCLSRHGAAVRHCVGVSDTARVCRCVRHCAGASGTQVFALRADNNYRAVEAFDLSENELRAAGARDLQVASRPTPALSGGGPVGNRSGRRPTKLVHEASSVLTLRRNSASSKSRRSRACGT